MPLSGDQWLNSLSIFSLRYDADVGFYYAPIGLRTGLVETYGFFYILKVFLKVFRVFKGFF